MKALIIIIFVLFACFVGWMMFALCWISGEADEAEEQIWSKKKGEERERDRERHGDAKEL